MLGAGAGAARRWCRRGWGGWSGWGGRRGAARVSREEVALLERLSLVQCETADGVRVLEKAIAFAERVLAVPTDGVEPLYTVLEHENLYLREDEVTDGNCKDDILRNAALTEEDYFVAPPGNIPLQDCTEMQVDVKQNIIREWFQSVFLRSNKEFKVLVNSETDSNFISKFDIMDLSRSKQKLPLGFIEVSKQRNDDKMVSTVEVQRYFQPYDATALKLNVLLPQQGAMQFFLQWQRYRKIWWSTITTSPGLFHLSDVNYRERSTEVEILAKFPWGQQAVEKIHIEAVNDKRGNSSRHGSTAKFVSHLTVECVLMTLLIDGFANRTPEDYLRLHRTMAPYKISFAIDCQDLETRKDLYELVLHLNQSLNNKRISTLLPADSDIPLEKQFVESCRLGVPYTAVLSKETLDSGILCLLNSSTTLKEQIHIADFENYTLQLLRSCFTV